MDQQHGEAAISDAAARVGNTVGNLTAEAGKVVQDKIDQAKPAFRDLRDSASIVMDKATDLAQKASNAGVQAMDTVQGVSRDVASQASQAATAVYQQGARAGGS